MYPDWLTVVKSVVFAVLSSRFTWFVFIYLFTGESVPTSDDLQCCLYETTSVSEADRTIEPPSTSPKESLHHRSFLPLPVHQEENPSIRNQSNHESGRNWWITLTRENNGASHYRLLYLCCCSHTNSVFVLTCLDPTDFPARCRLTENMLEYNKTMFVLLYM